ncbi:MAG: nitroreductase [Candidatus Lokiarchaeota archaeon]|nr:nitroreductase [Candidatus Lokiarchaeota archaeon]
MKIPVERWFNAIPLRHSQRKYNGERVEDQKLDKLQKICTDFRPFPGARIELVREPEIDPFKGIIGPIFKVKNAPHYMKFIVDQKEQEHQVVMGYIGEAAILEATALGLNTCWITGFFHSDKTNEVTALGSDERVIGISPVGIADKKNDTIGHYVDHKRKSVDDLILDSKGVISEWQKVAIHAARLAPSAINRQPWRFSFSNSAITISFDGKFDLKLSKRLDCGIAMLHTELGARKVGKTGSWRFEENPKVGTFSIEET